MTPKSPHSCVQLERRMKDKEEDEEEEKKKKKVVKKKPRKAHVIYKLGIAWVCAGEEREKGKKGLQKGQKNQNQRWSLYFKIYTISPFHYRPFLPPYPCLSLD